MSTPSTRSMSFPTTRDVDVWRISSNLMGEVVCGWCVVRLGVSLCRRVNAAFGRATIYCNLRVNSICVMAHARIHIPRRSDRQPLPHHFSLFSPRFLSPSVPSAPLAPSPPYLPQLPFTHQLARARHVRRGPHKPVAALAPFGRCHHRCLWHLRTRRHLGAGQLRRPRTDSMVGAHCCVY